jgi:hypothetical protein
MAAQLRGVLAAVQSAEVAQEDEHERPRAPIVGEMVIRAVRPAQRERSECREVHVRSVPYAGRLANPTP